MTHAAAATRTLRSPRRRPHGPAAGERAGAASGVVGSAALVIATGILSSTPSVGSTPNAHMVFGSGAADIVRTSTAPTLVIPAPREEV